ncbi:MAG: helix-turn-helix transcriptional regulator [Marinibacterium sp.]
MIQLRPPQHEFCPAPFRRGLSRAEAAEYIGVGTSKFDALVEDGRMPKPKKIDGRRVWDRLAVDRAFDDLDGGADAEANPWDD